MIMTPRRLSGSIHRALLASAATLLVAAPALGQDAATGANGAPSVTQLDSIVVTGRAGSGVRSKAETSYSVTNIEEESLRLQAPTSVTESLKSVPGFWVESSGGEASGNVRARGIPVDGFGSVNILEDGVPVVHDPSLGYLNGDQAFRLDETIERIEVVRGGPSSVIYPNAPAGAINYVPRQVGDETSGVFKYTVGDYGLNRLDYFLGLPLGNEWKLGMGGFYRKDDGIRPPGFAANDGGQFRINLAREFERGRISIDAKHMDDKVMLYLGIPMRTQADGDIDAVPGFDGNFGNVAGPETRHLAMPTGDGGVWDFDNAEGTHVKRDQLTIKFDWDLGGGWQIADALRLSDTQTTRNGVYPLSVASASSFLQAQQTALAGQLAQIPGASGLRLRYANGGAAFDPGNQNGNGLMMVGGLRGLVMPVKEITNDLRLSRDFEIGGRNHNLTFGYYYANTNEDFDRYSSNVLLDVQDNARLLDLEVVDAAGNVLATVTDHGVSRYGYEWGNASGESTSHALYVADEWQLNDALRIDAGVRWEQIDTQGWTEVRTSADGGTPATSNMLTGSDQYLSYDLSSDKVGWTLGANYQFSGNSGLFGRWTSAFRLPSLGNYLTRGDNACDGRTGAAFNQCVADRQAFNDEVAITQTMDLAEIGYKYGARDFSVFATGFYTRYDNVGFSNYVFDVNTGASTQQQGYASTKTFGLELEGNWYPVRWFDLQLTATLQNPEYEDLQYTENSAAGPVLRNYVGNQLIRVPKQSYRLVPGFNLFDDRLRLQLAWEHQGDRYVDTANSVRLPAYDVFNFSARYDVSERFSLYGYVDNIDNSLGLTEGNPRAGELASSDAGANTFLARPILGRSYRLALMYRF